MSRCYPFPPPGYIKNAHEELEISSKKEKRKHKDKKKKRKRKDNAANGDLVLQEDGSLERVQQSGLADDGFRTANERLSEATSMLPVASTQGNIKGLQNDIVRERIPSNCASASNTERPEQERQSFKVNNEGQGLSAKRKPLHTDIQRERGLRNGILAMDSTRSPQSVQVEPTTNLQSSSMLANQSKRSEADRPEKRWQSGELSNEERVLSTKCQSIQADIHGESMLRNGCVVMDMTTSPQSVQVESTTEVLTSSTLAAQGKRLKTDGVRKKKPSNGSAAVACKRAEQGLQADCIANEVFSNGLLSTKHTRLQADNHEGKLLPSAARSSLSKRPQQRLHCQAGDTNTEVTSNGVQATDRMSLQADRPSNKYLNYASTSERSESRFQANGAQAACIQGGITKAKELSPHLHNAYTDGAWAESVQVGTMKAKELPQHLHKAVRDGAQAVCAQVGMVKAQDLSQTLHKGVKDGAQAERIQVGSMKAKETSQYDGKLQADKRKHKVKSRSTLITDCQADNVRAKLASNGVHAGKSVQTMVPGNVVSNSAPDSAAISPINFSDKAFSGAEFSTKGKFLQGDTFAKTAFGNGVMEGMKRVQVGSSIPEAAASYVVGAVSCEGVEPANYSQHDASSNGLLDDGRSHKDKPRTKVLGTKEKFDIKSQEQAEKKPLSNGVLAMSREQFKTESPSLAVNGEAVARAVKTETAKDVMSVIPASGGNIERDDEVIRLCRRLARPHPQRVCAVADEDGEWLISIGVQRQGKPAEKWDRQIPRVWSEVEHLPSVDIYALPYVILS